MALARHTRGFACRIRMPLAQAIGSCTLAAAVAVGSAAGAAELASPLLARSELNDQLQCWVINVGSKPIKSITLELFAGSGQIATTSATDLQPNNAIQVNDDEPVGSLRGWCRATFTGGKKAVRAALSVADPTGFQKSIVALD